jgi:NTE family protein
VTVHSETKCADGVFSGGGVKAIAFAGALVAAEEAGYREWEQLAGTSAGAITAAALAVGYTGDALTRRLMEFDFASVADIGRPRHLAQLSNLIRHHAIARGRSLHGWISDLLEQAPRPARTFGELPFPLRVVGTDLVHHRMVVFPEDAGRYLDPQGRPWTPEAFPLADAVRISAGYPFMFAPVPLRDAATGQAGALVDGGIVSGFPVFLFDCEQPRHPTWGFQLGGEPSVGQAIRGYRWPWGMMRAILETSIGVHDRLDAQAFSARTIHIDTGNVPTLRFTLQGQDKKALWEAGHAAAAAFFASAPSGQNSYGAAPPARTLPAAGGDRTTSG